MQHPKHRSNRILGAIKLALGLALIGLLLWQAAEHDALQKFASQPKDWRLLAAALAFTAGANVLVFFRWYCVAHAGGVPLGLGEAVRLGALGFALNHVSLGSVGGDLFKGAIFARNRPGLRAAAVTTIVVDRFIGLAVVVMMAGVGVLASGAWGSQNPSIRLIALGALGAAGVTLVGAILAMLPWFSGPGLASLAQKIPRFGSIAHQAVAVWASYRRNPTWVLAAFGLSFAVHTSMAVSYYLISLSLPIDAPSLAEHLLIVPLASVAAGVLPLPNGLGSNEAVVELFYQSLMGSGGQGTIVALLHRVNTLLAGGIAAAYYFLSRPSANETDRRQSLRNPKVVNGARDQGQPVAEASGVAAE